MSREQAFPYDHGAVRNRHFDTRCLGLSIPSVLGIQETPLFAGAERLPGIHRLASVTRFSILSAFLIPVSSSLRIPTYKRTIRAYCRTYTHPTRRNRAWLTFSFVHQYIFKQSLPEKSTREVGKTTYTPQTWNCILFSVHNRHRSHCFGSIMKDWYCCTLL